MKILRLLALAAIACSLHGCASLFDTHSEMTPVPGTGEEPSVANRFPAKNGGLPPSAADEPHDNRPLFERWR